MVNYEDLRKRVIDRYMRMDPAASRETVERGFIDKIIGSKKCTVLVKMGGSFDH
jgi:hypothetical protein